MRLWKWTVPLLLAAIGATTLSCSWSPVASVNGQKITRREFASRLEEQHGQEVLEQLMVQKLIASEAERRGITVSEEEVEEELSRIRGLFETEEEFAEAVRQYYRMTPEMLKNSIRMDKLANRLRTVDVEVSEEDLQKYVKERPYVRHILLSTEAEARVIEKLLQEGGDFANLAQERSTDPGSKGRGGLLGFVKKGAMVEEFEKAAFALEPGQISPIVKSQFGYHIIRMDEPDLEEARENLKKDQSPPVDNWLSEMRQQARVRVYNDRYRELEKRFSGRETEPVEEGVEEPHQEE
jgi:foldase protein PrsA